MIRFILAALVIVLFSSACVTGYQALDSFLSHGNGHEWPVRLNSSRDTNELIGRFLLVVASLMGLGVVSISILVARRLGPLPKRGFPIVPVSHKTNPSNK
jgi:hypothetical protein